MARKRTLVETKITIPVTLSVRSSPESKATLDELIKRLKQTGPVQAQIADLELDQATPELLAAWQQVMADGKITAQLRATDIQAALMALSRGGELFDHVMKVGRHTWIVEGGYLPFVRKIWSDQPANECKCRQTSLSRALCIIRDRISTDIVEGGRGPYPARNLRVNLTKLVGMVAKGGFTLEEWLRYPRTRPSEYDTLCDFTARVQAVLG